VDKGAWSADGGGHTVIFPGGCDAPVDPTLVPGARAAPALRT
jgi:hypothetical protein